MKVQVNQVLKNFDGIEVKENNQSVTAKNLIVNALMAVSQDEQNLTGEEKMKRYILAETIYKSGDEADISLEDCALIKKLIGKNFAPIAVGFIYRLLGEN